MKEAELEVVKNYIRARKEDNLILQSQKNDHLVI